MIFNQYYFYSHSYIYFDFHEYCSHPVVGYTPFYAEEPVVTCRKILRWAHFLEVPDRIVSTVSSDCIDFLLGLITDSNKRY